MAASEIEKKVMSQEVPVVNKVAVAYSGGLDSSLAIELLRRVYKAKEIVPITLDIGQSHFSNFFRGGCKINSGLAARNFFVFLK